MRKLIPFLLFTSLSASASAQETRVRPLIRVAFVQTAEASALDSEFADSLRVELGKRRDLAYTKKGDFTVAVAVAKISRNDGAEVIGYAVATLVVESSTGRIRLSVTSMPTLAELAVTVAAKVDAENFSAKEGK